ncbi:MAG: ComF family protein [Candidatus Yanofskybacteria bacterium]|nr:ComF family protein [Candidatus Yanofskybacteria bacterium]
MIGIYPQKVIKLAGDAIFPIRCVGCGAYDTYFCAACLAEVKIKNDAELVGAIHVFSAANYSDKLIQRALKVFKYGFVRDMAGPLVEIVRTYVDNIPVISSGLLRGNPLVVPVPLHKKRLNWRGFNQSEILAEKIAGFYGLEVGNILFRNKKRKPQADIEDRESRMNNVADSFACSANINGRNVVLVDDICTTGATLNECAKVLAANGAGKISALVIARG